MFLVFIDVSVKCSPSCMRNIKALDAPIGLNALTSLTWGFYPYSLSSSPGAPFQLRQVWAILHIRLGTAPSPSDLLTELPGGPQNYPSSYFQWRLLLFLTQLPRWTLDLAWYFTLSDGHCTADAQVVTNLPCSGTVGLCPGRWSLWPHLYGGHPGLLAPWSKILGETFHKHLPRFVTCVIWLLGSIQNKKQTEKKGGRGYTLLKVNNYSLRCNN